MTSTADVTTFDSLYVLHTLTNWGAPAPDAADEFGNTLRLCYSTAAEATETYKAAQHLRLPLASLDDVTWAPWERADGGYYVVTFQHEELEGGN